MKARRYQLRGPCLTEDELFDPARFPIEPVLKQALSDDQEEFESGVYLLRCMYRAKREEAGVFLIGLLMTCGPNWEKRRAIAHALRVVQTEACVHLLVGELKRVKSSNTTRRYLNEVIDVLSRMPSALVLSRFEELADDKSFTPRMRPKFEAAWDDVASRREQGY